MPTVTPPIDIDVNFDCELKNSRFEIKSQTNKENVIKKIKNLCDIPGTLYHSNSCSHGNFSKCGKSSADDNYSFKKK